MLLLTTTIEEKDIYIDPKSHTQHSDKSTSDIVERYTDDEKRLHLDDLDRQTDEEDDPYTHDGDTGSTELKEADIHDEHVDTDVEPQTGEQFDWDIVDDDDSLLEENKVTESKIGNSRLFKCLASNSSSIAWSLNIIFGLIVIGVAIIIHVVYDDLEKPDSSVGPSNISMSLELWFTWLAFMWVISVAMHFLVEVIPWGIKTFFKIVMPSKTEIIRMRLAVSVTKANFLYIRHWLVGFISIIFIYHECFSS